jgi:hypothetical protein
MRRREVLADQVFERAATVAERRGHVRVYPSGPVLRVELGGAFEKGGGPCNRRIQPIHELPIMT